MYVHRKKSTKFYLGNSRSTGLEPRLNQRFRKTHYEKVKQTMWLNFSHKVLKLQLINNAIYMNNQNEQWMMRLKLLLLA